MIDRDKEEGELIAFMVKVLVGLLVVLLAVFALQGCAPMPGGRLLPGIKRPTALMDIPVLKIHDANIFQSTAKCNTLIWGKRPFLVLLAFGFIPSCARTTPAPDGTMYKCEVFAPIEFLLKHELEHCKGWADRWY